MIRRGKEGREKAQSPLLAQPPFASALFRDPVKPFLSSRPPPRGSQRFHIPASPCLPLPLTGDFAGRSRDPWDLSELCVFLCARVCVGHTRPHMLSFVVWLSLIGICSSNYTKMSAQTPHSSLHPSLVLPPPPPPLHKLCSRNWINPCCASEISPRKCAWKHRCELLPNSREGVFWVKGVSA